MNDSAAIADPRQRQTFGWRTHALERSYPPYLPFGWPVGNFLRPIIGGGDTTCRSPRPCSQTARAKPVLFEASAAEFTGFERARRSWVPPEMSSAEEIPDLPSLPLLFVELPIPLHKTRDTFFDRRRRGKSDISRQILNVRVCGRHVSRLNRQQLLHRFLS
ncbi:MAG: hypothetical protein JW395_0040 [Nitrospira sp.]|nr:hypothetical protein [Nitrospira sp.]